MAALQIRRPFECVRPVILYLRTILKTACALLPGKHMGLDPGSILSWEL